MISCWKMDVFLCVKAGTWWCHNFKYQQAYCNFSKRVILEPYKPWFHSLSWLILHHRLYWIELIDQNQLFLFQKEFFNFLSIYSLASSPYEQYLDYEDTKPLIANFSWFWRPPSQKSVNSLYVASYKNLSKSLL